jgi:hypothetical protein
MPSRLCAFVDCSNQFEVGENSRRRFCDEHRTPTSRRAVCRDCGVYYYSGEKAVCQECEIKYNCIICKTHTYPVKLNSVEISEQNTYNICNSCKKKIIKKYKYNKFKKDFIVHNYSFKPFTEFLHTKKEKANIYFGFENEVTFTIEKTSIESNLLYNAQLNKINDIIQNYNLPLIYKHDASIPFGVEIVSAPMSFEYFNSLPWEKLFSEDMLWIKERRVGMHIHMSKDAISHAQLFKMLKFFSIEKNFIEFIGERKSNSYCEAVSDDRIYDKAAKKGGPDFERDALNTCPEKTIEIRIFQGATDLNTFKKNIQFAQAFWEWTRCTSIKCINKDSFSDYVTFHKEKFTELYMFINNNNNNN